MVKSLEVVSSSNSHIRYRICDGTEFLIQAFYDWWLVDYFPKDILKSCRREFRTYVEAENYVFRQHRKAAKKILQSA